jgi:hypothetical protein
LRPQRGDIAAPPFPPDTAWIGEPPGFERDLAAGPALVHFFDFAQLNSVRTLPYLAAWWQRYREAGLTVLGVHSPRFPFTRSADLVSEALPRLGISWPVALDPEMRIWRDYEPHGWPALFLWARGGALRWYHLGEGEYLGTEDAIREALGDADPAAWPAPLEPLRPTDAPGAEVVAPTTEIFPGGAIERPWRWSPDAQPLTVEYQAGGAYVAADGAGKIAVRLDRGPTTNLTVEHPGLHQLASHERSERHVLELEASGPLAIYSVQFAAGVPSSGLPAELPRAD